MGSDRLLWFIQSNMFREDGYIRLIDALDRLGSDYVEVQVLPFTSRLIPAGVTIDGCLDELPGRTVPTDRPVFALGSYKLATIVASRGVPGAFFAGLRYDEWALHLHRRCPPEKRWPVLNPDACTGSLGSARMYGSEAFVRPLADSKTFTGKVFTVAEFRALQLAATTAQPGDVVQPDLGVLIAPVRRDIHFEVRCWVVAGKVVTASFYRRGGEVFVSDAVDAEVTVFAQRCVDLWKPNDAFVLDVAKTDEGFRVVEANCLSAAGFYAADMQKLVAAIEDRWGARYHNPDSALDRQLAEFRRTT